jgi:hypothetical protein
MHSEGVRVCAAIFVPASARALVACSGSCQRRHTTAMVTVTPSPARAGPSRDERQHLLLADRRHLRRRPLPALVPSEASGSTRPPVDAVTPTPRISRRAARRPTGFARTRQERGGRKCRSVSPISSKAAAAFIRSAASRLPPSGADPRPTAVLVCESMHAIALYRRLNEAGLRPGRDIPSSASCQRRARSISFRR